MSEKKHELEVKKPAIFFESDEVLLKFVKFLEIFEIEMLYSNSKVFFRSKNSSMMPLLEDDFLKFDTKKGQENT